MSDDGWPDGHDDDGYAGDGFGDELLPGGEDVAAGGDVPGWVPDDVFDDDPAPHGAVDEADVSLPGDDDPGAEPAEPPAAAAVDSSALGPVGADPDATAEPDEGGDVAFPPAVDVGPLPEPVDGFPWIDTGSLGVVAAGDADVPADPADPREVAAYAAADLPPGADPWAALAASDDPATAALARWWSEHGH